MWVPNDWSVQCTDCHSKFTVFRRRVLHHAACFIKPALGARKPCTFTHIGPHCSRPASLPSLRPAFLQGMRQEANGKLARVAFEQAVGRPASVDMCILVARASDPPSRERRSCEGLRLLLRKRATVAEQRLKRWGLAVERPWAACREGTRAPTAQDWYAPN